MNQLPYKYILEMNVSSIQWYRIEKVQNDLKNVIEYKVMREFCREISIIKYGVRMCMF